MQLDAIVNFISEGVLLLELRDRTVVPLFVSESFYQLDQPLPHVEFYGDAFRNVYPEDAHDLLMKLQIGARNGVSVEHTFRVVRQGNLSLRHVKAIRVPYEDNPNPIMIVVEDIGHRTGTCALLESNAS